MDRCRRRSTRTPRPTAARTAAPTLATDGHGTWVAVWESTTRHDERRPRARDGALDRRRRALVGARMLIDPDAATDGRARHRAAARDRRQRRVERRLDRQRRHVRERQRRDARRRARALRQRHRRSRRAMRRRQHPRRRRLSRELRVPAAADAARDAAVRAIPATVRRRRRRTARPRRMATVRRRRRRTARRRPRRRARTRTRRRRRAPIRTRRRRRIPTRTRPRRDPERRTPTETPSPDPNATATASPDPNATATPTPAATAGREARRPHDGGEPDPDATATPGDGEPTPGVTPFGGGLASRAAAKAAVGCQRAVVKSGAQLVGARLTQLGACGRAIAALHPDQARRSDVPDARRRRGAGAPSPSLAATDGKQAAALRANAAAERSRSPTCSARPGSASDGSRATRTRASLDDLVGCVVGEHGCRSAALFEVLQPRAKELMRLPGHERRDRSTRSSVSAITAATARPSAIRRGRARRSTPARPRS